MARARGCSPRARVIYVHKSLPTVVLILHSDWSLLLLANIHGSFYCKHAMLLVNLQSSLHCKQGSLQEISLYNFLWYMEQLPVSIICGSPRQKSNIIPSCISSASPSSSHYSAKLPLGAGLIRTTWTHQIFMHLHNVYEPHPQRKFSATACQTR